MGHEGLWVLIGTAAPVIAIGNTVTVVRGIDLLHCVKLVRRHTPEMWPRTLRSTYIMLVTALLSLAICVEVLFFSAISLASNQDVTSPPVQAVLSALSLVLLLPQLATEAWIRGMTYFDEEVSKARVAQDRAADPTYTNVARQR